MSSYETSAAFSELEKRVLDYAVGMTKTPAEVSDELVRELRKHFDEPQIVELVSVASLYAFLNRYNDTLANDLEDPATEWASAHLAPGGWELGKHAPRVAS